MRTVSRRRAGQTSQGHAHIPSAKLEADIRRYLTRDQGPHRRRVLDVQIRNIDGGRVSGFVSLMSEETRDKFLLDFEARLSQQGALSSLSVDEKRIPISLARLGGGVGG